MVTQDEKDALLASIAKAASAAGSQLSNLGQAKKKAEALTVEVVQSTLLVGMSYGGNTDPAPFESQVGRPVGVWRLYYQASEVAKAEAAIARAGQVGRGVVWASFKLPASWSVMASGGQDGWVTDLGQRLSAAAVTAGVSVVVCLHHEPEGDGPLADYVAMQQHCLPMLHGLPNVQTSIILTGYPQQYGGGLAAWTLDACYPGPSCDLIGVDPYLMYGTWQDYNKTPPMVTSWTPPDATMQTFSAFAAAHGCGWAVAETGETNEAYNSAPAGKDGPGFLPQQVALAASLGARFWCYFASTLNSRGSWEIDSVDAQSKRATLAALIAHQ